MHRNVSGSRRNLKPAARPLRRVGPLPARIGGGGSSRKLCSTSKVMLLSCVAIALLFYSWGSEPLPSSPPPQHPSTVRNPSSKLVSVGEWARYMKAADMDDPRSTGTEWAGVGIDGQGSLLGGNASLTDRERWKEAAGWGSVADDSLEDWAPLGPDPAGCLPRAPELARPSVFVGWGFGNTRLTLYSYRSLESLLHVYPGAHVQFLTTGPRYAYYYKWANIIAATHFQKYSKRGYDVTVEIYFGKAIGKIKKNGRTIPGHRWWHRHKDDILYGRGLEMKVFQATQDALPDASVTLFLALLELYKSGGIYVDLTTFFVRPLPPGLDGFIVGGEGEGSGLGSGDGLGGGNGDCSLLTASDRRQRGLVMQYSMPEHPVVQCALTAYDEETSDLNACVAKSKGKGYGGLDCVLEALEKCTIESGMRNDLGDAGVVEWHGCSEDAARSYSQPMSTSTSATTPTPTASNLFEMMTGIPPAPRQARVADTPGSVEAPEDVAGDWGADGGGGMDVGGIDVGKDGSVIGVKVGGLTSRTDDEDDETDTGEATEHDAAAGERDWVERESKEDGDGVDPTDTETPDQGKEEDEKSSSNSSSKSSKSSKSNTSETDRERDSKSDGKSTGESSGDEAGGVIHEGGSTGMSGAHSGDPTGDPSDGGGGRGEVNADPIVDRRGNNHSRQDADGIRNSQTAAGSKGGAVSSPSSSSSSSSVTNARTEDGRDGKTVSKLGDREESGDANSEEGTPAGLVRGDTILDSITTVGHESEEAIAKGDDSGGEADVGRTNLRRLSSLSGKAYRSLHVEDARKGGVGNVGEVGFPPIEEGVTSSWFSRLLMGVRGESGGTEGSGDGNAIVAGGSAGEAAAAAAAEAAAMALTVATGGVSRRAHKVSLLWLGPEVADGSWHEPAEGSLWQEAFSRLRLTKWKPQHVSASCRTPCGHWDTLSAEGKTSPEGAKAQASFQCAPQVFVPGTQKGASTFLFHAITWHPQVVQPLRGAHGFKETGRYTTEAAMGPKKLGVRLAAFPFLEEHENIVTGDGTVTYMLHGKAVPRAILKDSPHAKIVFALRDPVARAWSDYRFLWNVYAASQPGFPQVIDLSLGQVRTCFEGHDGPDSEELVSTGGGPGQLVVSDGDEEGISHFYSRCSTTKDPGQIVRKGLYYYQVLHWVRVFGRDNVMVVDSADLKSRQKETIEGVYRFLGLCPADISTLEPENVTHPPNIPEDKKINEKSFKALQDFYAPYNKKLYKLLGRDLGWERNTFKSE